MTRRLGRPPHPDLLTPAEWRVADAVRHGLSNPAIARRMGVTTDAVKFHVGNILAKLALPDRHALRMWSGVAADSALAAQGACMNDDFVLGALGQVARSVSDIASAKRWYRDVLGLPLLYDFGTLAFFDCGGVRLMLTQGEGAADTILYFRVRHIHGAVAALQRRGIVFSHAPHRIHTHADGSEEWMAFFNDPQGRPLALMSQVPPTAAAGTAEVTP